MDDVSNRCAWVPVVDTFRTLAAMRFFLEPGAFTSAVLAAEA